MTAGPIMTYRVNRGTTKPTGTITDYLECERCGCWHEKDKCPIDVLEMAGIPVKREFSEA